MQKSIFKTIWEQSSDGLALFKIIRDEGGVVIDYQLTEANALFEKLSGLKTDHILNQGLSQIAMKNPFGRIPWKDLYDQVVRDKKPAEFEYYAEAMTTWFKIKIFSVDKDWLVTHCVDISNPIEETDPTLNRPFIMMSANGELISVNKAWKTLSGYKGQKWRKLNYLQLVHPKHRKTFEGILHQRGEQTNSKKFNHLFRHVEGHYISVDWEYHKRSGIVYGVSQPLNQHAQDEERFSKSEYLFRSLWENSNDGMRLTDAKGVMVLVNRAFCDLVGKDKEELEGHTLDVIYNADPDEQILPRYMANYRNKRIVPYFEKKLNLWDNRLIWLAVSTAVIEVGGEHHYILSVFRDISAIKNSEAALKESKEKYQNFLEKSSEGIFLIEYKKPIDVTLSVDDQIAAIYENGYVAECNMALTRMYGLTSPEQLIGKSLIDLHGNPPSKINYEATKQFIQSNYQIENVETIESDIHGHERCFLNNTIGILEDGKLLGNWGVQNDITEMKQAAAALQRSETLLRTIFDTAPYGIFVKDKDLRYVKVNDAIVSVFGLSLNHFIGKTDEDIFGSDKIQQIKNADRRVLDGEIIEEFPSGGIGDQIQYYHTIKVPLIDEDGQISGLFGITRDITERHRAEQKLKEQGDAMEAAIDGMAVLDRNHNYIYVNKAHAAIYGYDDSSELIGKSWQVLYDGVELQRFHREIMPEVDQQGQWHGRATGLKKDGTTFPQELSLTALDNGGLICVVRDISDQLKTEAEKEKLEEQYRQAQKMESIGRLAGGVAHDLNNLLTPVLGYGEMLLKSFNAHDKRKKSAAQIIRAGIRARDLVRQLLAFSRKQTLEFKPIDVNKLVHDFQSLLRRTIREDIAISLYTAPDLPTIQGDIVQLEQIIMNLAVNAQDAMPEGGTLTIETGSTELDKAYAARHDGVTPGHYVLLAISDNGHGMDEATQQRLFEPFFTTKEKGKGTGLGLATVYGIVKQHGGNIWVYSEKDSGTTFKIYLPVAGEGPAAESLPTQKALDDMKGTETILLVEDNEMVRKLASEILQQQGYQVLLARDGAEALALVENHREPLHLLLTDVIMPEMNGRQLYARVSEKYPRIKVLYMSGYTENVIAHCGVLDEGVHFIPKPFTVDALIGKIRELLK